MKRHEWNGYEILVENGEFAPFMRRTAENLERCEEFAANDNQRNMLRDYVEHFLYGEYDPAFISVALRSTRTRSGTGFAM